jgi:DNA-binding NtrC family response regulator
MPDAEPLASREGRRVLVVDDDQAVLRSVGEYFSRIGYEVVRAATGREAIAAFTAHDPDVTILDLRLPDIDGMQVLGIMREQRAIVILLTGYGDIPTAVRAMQLGAENFLTKPVDLPHLVATVDRAFEKLSLRRENLRLRRLVPSTRRRVIQAAIVLLVAAAALLAGRWIGAVGGQAQSVPLIAPIRPATVPPLSDTAAPAAARQIEPTGASRGQPAPRR